MDILDGRTINYLSTEGVDSYAKLDKKIYNRLVCTVIQMLSMACFVYSGIVEVYAKEVRSALLGESVLLVLVSAFLVHDIGRLVKAIDKIGTV